MFFSKLFRRSSTKADSKVKYIKDMQEYEALLETSKSKLVVVDFTAKWCGPCRMIAPILEKLANINPDVEFVKVDVDEARDVSTACGIECMPTFHFYKGGEKIDELIGADAEELKKKVAKLVEENCPQEQE